MEASAIISSYEELKLSGFAAISMKATGRSLALGTGKARKDVADVTWVTAFTVRKG